MSQMEAVTRANIKLVKEINDDKCRKIDRAIKVIFESGKITSRELRNKINLSYAPSQLFERHLKSGWIVREKIKSKANHADSMYSIKAGLSLADFGIEN